MMVTSRGVMEEVRLVEHPKGQVFSICVSVNPQNNFEGGKFIKPI